ncbi:hypothetical protein HDF18_08115 [Mucilaginibacter sp. X5P1]|uniref:hypothetical protein n=1 Tax=Mucilaginibacter sp. X5P1 TaxID=2723088 RepID=UPI00161778DC|nr:hypothetical protein [Mucilaginibacter sp. X5P1]MBB6137620.1 hypothetical protein [Mucilaginibacter sp. X5P1]
MINKLALKKLVEFRRLSEKRQANFANQLKVLKVAAPVEGGGDYWKRSTSGLSNAFKDNDSARITEKIEAVVSVYQSTTNVLTKKMYERNLDILHNYVKFDFSNLRPEGELKFLTKSKELLTIDNVPLQILPHHVFTFGKSNATKVGAIWFVAWLERFSKEDLGLYAEAQFNYLSNVYEKQYSVDPRYCLTVDILTMETVSYDQILQGKIKSQLQSSVDSLNRYLN